MLVPGAPFGWVPWDTPRVPDLPEILTPRSEVDPAPAACAEPAPGPAPTPAWREHASDLYDLLLITRFDWPVSTLKWLPWCTPDGRGRSRRTLLFGNGRGELQALPHEKRKYLCVAHVLLPDHGAGQPPRRDDDDRAEAEEVRVVQRVNHDGAVRDAAYNPFWPYCVSTATETGDVCVFNLRDFPSEPPLDGRCMPSVRLRGHAASCRSVAWNPHQDGLVASSASDSRINIWDVQHTERSGGLPLEQPLRRFQQTHGTGGACGATFCPDTALIVASVGMDGRVCMWDLREEGSVPVSSADAHAGGSTTLAFAPGAGTSVATGGHDHVVRLWDLRSPRRALCALDFHDEGSSVSEVAWLHERHGYFLASAGTDRRVLIWDPDGSGAAAAAATDGTEFPASLVFIHDAHDAAAHALSGSPPSADGSSPRAVLASADSGGAVQVWEVSEDILRAHEQRKRW